MNNDFSEKYTTGDYFELEGEVRFSSLYPKLLQIANNLHGKKVLDFGCGHGELAVQFARAGADVLGVDIALSGIKSAKKKYKDAINLYHMEQDNFDYIQTKAPFDIILVSLVLGNMTVQAAVKIMNTLQLLLADTGTLLLADAHPCSRDMSYSTCSQKFSMDDYRHDDVIYEFELYDAYLPEKTVSMTSNHYPLATLCNMICGSGLLIKSLHEVYDKIDETLHPDIQARLNDKVPPFLIIEAVKGT